MHENFKCHPPQISNLAKRSFYDSEAPKPKFYITCLGNVFIGSFICKSIVLHMRDNNLHETFHSITLFITFYKKIVVISTSQSNYQ